MKELDDLPPFLQIIAIATMLAAAALPIYLWFSGSFCRQMLLRYGEDYFRSEDLPKITRNHCRQKLQLDN